MFLEDSPSERKVMQRGEEEQAANYHMFPLQLEPIVIWTSENPRCFTEPTIKKKGLDDRGYLRQYFNKIHYITSQKAFFAIHYFKVR